MGTTHPYIPTSYRAYIGISHFPGTHVGPVVHPTTTGGVEIHSHFQLGVEELRWVTKRLEVMTSSRWLFAVYGGII